MLDEAARDAVAETLGRHYAAGHLDADQLDDRLEALLQPDADHAQASALLADLPVLATPPAKARRSWWRGRHGESRAAQPGWLPTSERFRDPSSGRLVRVWVDPADGGRRYVPED